MTCSQAREWIDEYVDDTLAPIRRAELERHLESCAECRALAADVRSIRATATSLDRLQPRDVVWLQIAGRLRQEGRIGETIAPAARPAYNRAVLALAAALVLAVGASMYIVLPEFLTTRAARSDAGTPASGSQADGAVKSVEEEFRLAEQHYQNAIAKLEQAAKLDQATGDTAIDPQTAETLQKNLKVIDQAIAESRAALRSEPLSVPARDSLFDALKRKLALLQDTIALMNEMRKGNASGGAHIVDGLNKS
jgi:anti-sigma factor RsiW